ncbi:diguanylate cyclase (GGDEF) domain-containing protein [Thiohalospira halophila DSM 15071]|uniref:Diguanylate cyclase (GGDEF) domain-containing protein n=1 Tax=Thiohalospira halophila DSM 15071 TaxID=1123397 RepID=A0A1I1R8E7_9GAMM|nr:phosphodiesterase [Thiohalospira halophila]SFD30621.1 diguanylate cyclase (GGDEF) domain-containing protein [Thiohalospira halophila DSM 15071]
MAADESSPEAIRRDARTGLANREAFYRETEPLAEQALATGGSLVLLVVDIDNVDFALRTFGPRERDEVVRAIGERLEAAAPEGVRPYHIMQGRFTLVLQDIPYQRAVRVARALLDACREPLEVQGAPYRLEAQVGVGHFPHHADTLDQWVRAAVFATHQARTTRSGYAIFDTSWDRRDRQRFRRLVDLGEALEHGDEICVAYQPQVDLTTGECTGVEALCRWEHPREGLIPPGDFMPFAEQSHLIGPLTEAVVAEALADLASWRERGFGGDVSINLSPGLFRDPDLQDRLMAHFRFANMDPQQVRFEVTESGIIEEPNRGINTLAAFRSRGSRISVDDFGTGHSSLAYLADLPVDELKIDKHFIQGLGHAWGEAIVGASVTLAGKLGLDTVAEGIETELQRDKCRELGCGRAQGFFTGRPMFRADFEAWLGLQ